MVTALSFGTGFAETQSADVFDSGRFFVGCNYWASHAGMHMWRDWDSSQVERDFDLLAAHGLTVLRVFPLWPDFQPLTAEFGGGGAFRGYAQNGEPLKNEAAVDEEMVERFRFMCKAAEKRGLRLVVGLVTGWMSGRLFAPTALERKNLLTDPDARMWQVRYVRHFVRALRIEPAIVAWDLGNECNCMAQASASELWNWMHQIGAEIRLNDPTRPVVSGMHSVLTTLNGGTNMRQQGELMDVLTTHPYPLWTPNCNVEPFDTMRNECHAACETTLYANLSGKRAFVEEGGSMGPGIVSEERAAASLRAALFSCWAAGIPGYCWWCAFDQGHLGFAPYDWTAIERELGLFTADGKAKPTACALRDFASFVEGLPFGKLPPRRIDAVVVVSEKEDAWKSAQGAWLLARRAGFDIRYARAEDTALPEARFYVLPSGSGYETYSRAAFWRVMEKAREGATVLLTLGEGAVLSDLEATAGVRTESHYGQPSSRDVRCGEGSFTVSDSFTRNVSAITAKVLLKDDAGMPFLTVNGYGKGKVLLCNAAIEAGAPQTAEGVYRLAAREAGVKRAVAVDNPSIGLTEHPTDGGRCLVVAVNYEPREVASALSVDGRVGRVYRGTVENGRIRMGANDAAVFEVQ
ncbi:MAG: beta-mannanase [bacterium]|nr:beta-mannanase [Candidatus Colisoma equi]